MRDGVEMERRGIPTATICWQRFEGAARAQARELGMPSLPLVVVPEPPAWGVGEEAKGKLEAAVASVIEALTKGGKAAQKGG